MEGGERKAGRPKEIEHGVPINVRIEDHVYALLAAEASRTGRSMGSFVREALGMWERTRKRAKEG